MKQEVNTEHKVCTGDTMLDMLQRTGDRMRQQMIQERGGRIALPPNKDGEVVYLSDPEFRYPIFGDKEFPDNRWAANLATAEHQGDLRADQKRTLEAFRKYPNSKILGEYELKRVEGTLTAQDKKDFFQARVEAGCVKNAHIANDGSIVFDKK